MEEVPMTERRIPNLFVFTAANQAAQDHLRDTIQNPVSPEVIKSHVDVQEFEELQRFANGQFYCWGATPGERNVPNWQAMKAGDDILCYYGKAYHFYAKVIFKLQNKELAKQLWGTMPDGSTWEYIYFLSEPRSIVPPIQSEETSDVLQSQFQGFSKIKDDKVNALYQEYGNLEGFINANRQVLSAEGLVVVDSGSWFEGAMAELKQAGHIALWWSKRPVGVESTLAELRSRLDAVGHFNLYYTLDRKARYRARVIDFATEADYSASRWREKRTIAEIRERFEDYKGESPNGRMQQARIAFLVNRMERLEPEIPILRFRFKNGPDGLTQDNMLPYARLMKEPEWSDGAEPLERYSEQDQPIREEFKKYLSEVVGASSSTVDQYLGSMPYLQRWFIDMGAADAGFNIWRDHASVQAIQSKLDGATSAAWTELNKKQNNSRRAPWNHWRRFLEKRNNNAMRFTDENRAILCAIKTKPFILLAGISGTGKSRMVRTLAYQTCSVPELRGDRPGNYALIMVKPNWHDPTELIGYVSRIDGQPKYVVTEFLRFLVKAWRYPQLPFFLCLDEMNLAPVEQYFADYLSVVETRRVKDGTLITDAILSKANMDEPSVFEGALAKLGLDDAPALKEQFLRDGITLPPNLVVMGTVNMDETTHSFSRKVLDRAMTFEMNQVDLRGGLEAEDKKWTYADPAIAANLVLGDLTRGGAVPSTFAQREDVLKWLEQLNGILEGTPFKVAYRVRDEFLIYAYHNSLLSDKPANWLEVCLDELLVMKVLSRIEGDENRVGEVLTKLAALVPDTWEHSTKKLYEMQRKLTFGYTSFWS